MIKPFSSLFLLKKKRSNLAWHFLQYGIFLLPFIPLLSAVSLIVAMAVSWKKQYKSLRKYTPNFVLGIFIIWLLITSCLAFKPREAWLGISNFVPFIIFLSTSGVFIQKISQLRHIAWLIVLPSLPIVGLGLGQLFCGWESIPLLNNLNLGLTLIAYGEPRGRMSSIFTYANILAAYLVIVFILGLGLWLDNYLIWRGRFNKKGKILFGILSLTVIIDAIGLILTDSRNAWIIAIIGCLSFALYLGYRWLFIAITTVAGLVAGASWGPPPLDTLLRNIVPAYFWARLSDELYPDRSLGSLRTTQWEFAWEMMLQHPVFGWGLRNFSPLYQAKVGEWFGHPHNFFLMLLAEIGIPGTVLLCSLVAWVMMQAIQILKMLKPAKKITKLQASDHLIFFTYLVTFGSCVLFNLFDVTIFNTKVNILGWVLFSTIWGIVYNHFQSSKKNLMIEK